MDAEKNTSDFWQDHSLTFLEMAFRTDCRERLDKPDGYGKKVGDCGDTVEFFINLDGDILGTLAYDINGCLNTNADAGYKGRSATFNAEKNTSDFWQDHSLTFLEMAFRTDCRERLDKPDGYGKKSVTAAIR
jgi:hypothetical protein